jgi:hypothetical protein
MFLPVSRRRSTSRFEVDADFDIPILSADLLPTRLSFGQSLQTQVIDPSNLATRSIHDYVSEHSDRQ